MEPESFGLTVIVVSHNRPALLSRALETMANALKKISYQVDLKILINGVDPESVKVCRQFAQDFPNYETEIRTISFHVTPAEGRNLLADKLKNSWIFFMDDDIQVPADLFMNFQKLCTLNPNHDAWGGPNLTPIESAHDAQRNGWFVENFWIVGPVSARYRYRGYQLKTGGQFNLMLCNFFVKTHLFIQEKFSPQLKTAEENDLIYKIQARAKKIGYSDSLFVWHERRANYKVFLKQIFYYGYGRGQLFQAGNLLPQWHFILYPVLFMLGLSLLILLPAEIGALLLGMMLFVQTAYFIKFRKLCLWIWTVPVTVWTLYFLGIIRGIFHTTRGNNEQAILLEK